MKELTDGDFRLIAEYIDFLESHFDWIAFLDIKLDAQKKDLEELEARLRKFYDLKRFWREFKRLHLD